MITVPSSTRIFLCVTPVDMRKSFDSLAGLVRDHLGENNIREARIWVYLGDQKNRFTVFDFTDSRKRDGPKKFQDGFRGYLQADAFAGYDCIYASGDVNECACMAHARRKFYDCLSTDRRTAEEMLEMIRQLYLIERDGSSLNDDGRRRLRLSRSAPILTKCMSGSACTA
jgi:transposase